MATKRLQAWRRALGVKPDQFQLMQVMAVEYGKGRYHREAADIAMRALQLRPDVEALFYMAIHACREAGDLSAGLELASSASKRYPNSARANFEYAWHLQKDGRFEEALPFLRRAIEIDPTYEEPHSSMGTGSSSKPATKRPWNRSARRLHCAPTTCQLVSRWPAR